MSSEAIARNDNLPVEAFRSSFGGVLIQPGDEGYEAARVVTYGGIDKHPALIAQAKNADDVVRAVNFARDNGLELAVRSGGHSAAGHSTTEGGLVIDLRNMNAIQFDTEARTAWAEAGATAEQFTKKAEELGLVVGFGDAGTVGLGGIVTGGGVGYLSRLHGLTIDSLLAAEIVTADGKKLTANPETNPDLFWALRGGGGNFGVVTRFKFRLQPLPSFTGGMLLIPASPETIAGFVTAAEAAPEALSGIGNVMPAPPMPFLKPEDVGKLSIIAMLAYAGPPEEAEKALKPFRDLAPPLADFVKTMGYSNMYPPEDPNYRPIAVSKNLFVDHVGIAEAQTIAKFLADSDAPLRVTQIRVLGGAVARVPADATAYAHRKSRIMLNLAAFYDGSEGDRVKKNRWLQDFAKALDQGDTGAYVNFVGDEGEERVRAAYPGATWDRLRAIKAKYDPKNLFRLNQNIPPAV
jgi:FAD/FMN-containing dehydrogenase